MQPTMPASSIPPAGAEAPPELVTSFAWPPLILSTQVPWLTRARDMLLTLLAWLIYVVILRKPIVNLIGWASPSLGALLRSVIPVDYAVDTAPYLWAAAGLVLVLVLNGMRRRESLRRVPSIDHEVPPLLPDAQFEAAGVPVAKKEAWRNARCLHVRFGPDGRIEGASAMTPDGPPG